MYANPGARERAFNLRILIRGAQLTTLWLRKNTFSGVHESGRRLFLRWSSEVRKKTCSRMRPIVLKQQQLPLGWQ